MIRALGTRTDGLESDNPDPCETSNIKDKISLFEKDYKSDNSNLRGVKSNKEVSDILPYANEKDKVEVLSVIDNRFEMNNYCHLSSKNVYGGQLEGVSSIHSDRLKDKRSSLLPTESHDQIDESCDMNRLDNSTTIDRSKGAIPKKKIEKKNVKGTQSIKENIQKKKLDKEESLENINEFESNKLERKKVYCNLIDVPLLEKKDIKEPIDESKERNVDDGNPKDEENLQLTNMKEKERKERYINDGNPKEKENLQLTKMKNKESNWLRKLSEKYNRKEDWNITPKKLAIGKKIDSDRKKKESMNKKKKSKDNLKKDMKRVKEINTPNRIEKMFNDMKKENAKKENINSVKSMIEKFESSGAVRIDLKHTEKENTYPNNDLVKLNHLSTGMRPKRIEFGSQTIKMKGDIKKEMDLEKEISDPRFKPKYISKEFDRDEADKH